MLHREFSRQISGVMDKARLFLSNRYQLSETDLDDVIQNAALKSTQKLPSFRGECSLETWFFSICKSEVQNLFRDKNKYDTGDSSELLKNIPMAELKPDDRSEECRLLLEEAMKSLNEKHRQIIQLVVKDCGSSQNLAKALNIPISTARTRLFYAKKKLKELLANNNKGAKIAH